ncbi:MAG TPA: hypothetical protein VGN35_12530 [Jatrophihabitantaceae bacterium]|nr:hypothetical protein [Jatrophihabitantaceae bacterium]
MRNAKQALGVIDSALHGGEQVLAWIPAMSPDAADTGATLAGVLALTTERILFHGLLCTARDQAVPLNSIIAVDLKRGLIGHLTFITVTGSVRFEVNGRGCQRWLSVAEAQMLRAAHRKAVAVPSDARRLALH